MTTIKKGPAYRPLCGRDRRETNFYFLDHCVLVTACSGDGDSARSSDPTAPTKAIETAAVGSTTPTAAMTTPTAGTSAVGIPTTGSTGAVATPTASAANEVREQASPAPGVINVWVYGDAQVQNGPCVTLVSQMIPDSAPQSIGGRAATCEYRGVDFGRLRFTKSRDGVLRLASVQLLLLASKTLPKELQVQPVSCLELKQYLFAGFPPLRATLDTCLAHMSLHFAGNIPKRRALSGGYRQ